MSTLSILLRDDCIHILTDTAGIDVKTGRFIGEYEKARVIKKTNLVMIVQGILIHADMLQQVFEATTETYEDALIAGRNLEMFFNLIKDNAAAHPKEPWNLVLAGFDATGSQLHAMSNSAAFSQGRKTWRWHPVPKPGCAFAPAPSLETAAAAVEAVDPEPLFPALLQEQRAASLRDTGMVRIGGRVTHLLITKDGIQRREIGGWPDEIGQPLNPFLKFVPAKPAKAAA